jgi:hypothetical protein
VWSTHAKLYENVAISEFDKIKRKTTSDGGTELKCALGFISDKFFDPTRMTEIMIITDGEIYDTKEDIIEEFTTLAKNLIQIKIIAVEPNDKDYLNSSVCVGNTLYKVIRDGKLTRVVERFAVYNQHEVEFINMSNPKVKTGFLPYNDTMFPIKDFNKFVQYMKNEIKKGASSKALSEPSIKALSETSNEVSSEASSETSSETSSESSSKTSIKASSKASSKASGTSSLMLKIIQNLSLTIYHYTKDKSYQNQVMIVDLFSNLLKGTEYYSDMRSILLNEINNHETGKISTFSELRKAKYTKIENTIIDLMNDTKGAITAMMTPKDFTYSFPLLDQSGRHHIIKSYDQYLSDIRLGTTTYHNCGLKINGVVIPLMFDFDKTPNYPALQWLKMVYSERLNVSISNEHLYYYVLCDAYLLRNTEASAVMQKYVELILADLKYGTNLSIIQDIEKTNIINIPYGVLQDAVRHRVEPSLKPLAMYYDVCNHYLLQYVKDKQPVIESLKKYCEKEINAAEPSPDVVISIINREKASFIGAHKYLDDIDCPCRACASSTTRVVCELCGAPVKCVTIEERSTFTGLDKIRENYIFNTSRHVNLGMLDGLPDNHLLLLDHFDAGHQSFSVDNTMIVDPISNARMKIKSREEFNKFTHIKYPFLSDINMKNVALCGGFVRSILLKQQMKDFDFFFYGLGSDSDYINRVKTLSDDVVKSLRKINPDYKFSLFYKPQYNVIELICYEDPKNHIQEDFTLEFFDRYKFKSMKKFRGKGDETHSKKTKVDTKFFFEDNDDKGIKMKYRVQLVMCKYDTISNIFRSFDMFPSQVAYDGTNVYFTPKSLIAYQYMINEINILGGTDMVKHRISKYFKYGFSIVFPKSTRNWQGKDYDNNYEQENIKYKGTDDSKGPLKFKVRQVCLGSNVNGNGNGTIIYVNHNSNMEQMEERNLKLEKKAKKTGDALYTSTMFCSFVAVLRYIKINEIPYAFPIGDKVYDVYENDEIKLTKRLKLVFVNEQKSIYKTDEWYDKFAKSIILNNYKVC